jgi:hypothetical protein
MKPGIVDDLLLDLKVSVMVSSVVAVLLGVGSVELIVRPGCSSTLAATLTSSCVAGGALVIEL